MGTVLSSLRSPFQTCVITDCAGAGSVILILFKLQLFFCDVSAASLRGAYGLLPTLTRPELCTTTVEGSAASDAVEDLERFEKGNYSNIISDQFNRVCLES